MILQPGDWNTLSNRDQRMMQRARTIALTSTERHKHAAILYKGGRVLAVGINSARNQHPTMEIDFSGYTRHAEIATMRATGWWNYDYEGATLYVVRVNKSYDFMLSKPCRDCEKALESNGIKRVVYSV